MTKVRTVIRDKKSNDVYQWLGLVDSVPTSPELKVLGRKHLRKFLTFNFIRKDRRFDYEVLKVEVVS